MKEPEESSTRRAALDLTAHEQELRTRLGSRGGSCPPLDVLLATGEGVLPPELETAASRHVQRCALCRQLLADLAEVTQPALLSGQDGPTLPEDQRIRTRIGMPLGTSTRPVSADNRWILAIAAALLLFLGGFAAWRMHHVGADRAAGRVARQVPPLIPPDTPPPGQFAHLDIPFAPLAPPSSVSGLVTRGASRTNPSLEELLPAFQAYNKGDYPAAAARFARLEPRYATSALLPLYRGVSLLAMDDNAAAAISLQRASNLSTTSGTSRPAADDARWYAAVAASREHDTVRVAQLLAGLCANKASVYSAQSCALLAHD